MAVGAEAQIILSDNDDDDCVLEAIIHDSCSKKCNNNIIYDNVFKENPLLAEVIEKCLELENSEGMYKVINKTLLKMYENADPKFKFSQDFERILKKTLINLDKDPNHKFSHIKDLCELLKHGGKKRAKLIMLDKNVKRKTFEELSEKRKSCFERRNKKQMSGVIDLDKYEEVPIINLDQVDTADLDAPIVIDDEKENHSSQENGDCCMEIYDEEDNSQNLSSEITNATLGTVNHVEISKNPEVLSKNEQPSEVHRNKEIIEYCKETNDKLVQDKEIISHSLDNPEKLLVPQIVLDLTDDNDSSKEKEKKVKSKKEKEEGKEKRIKDIEKDIAMYKELILVLDEKEVTDDTYNSPYVQSEKYKEKIVSLYKELCKLTGSETTKRREVRLKAMEGHPPGPVERLQRFLNRNIGEDGNPPFPDFSDVLKCVSLANEKDNLGWSKGRVMHEATLLFTHCGRALQKRRLRREWSDLLSRAKAEDCDGDPADRDPELLARLEANRQVAISKEADLLERYTLMQLLPSQQEAPANIPPPDNNLIQDDSVDERDSAQTYNENKTIGSTKENMSAHNKEITAHPDVNPDLHHIKSNNKLTYNTPNYLIQNGKPGMPNIILESITNKTYSDEFGLMINKSKEISNVEINKNGLVESFAANVKNNDIHCNVVANNNNVASLRIEDNVGKVNFQDHTSINLDIVNGRKEISIVEINWNGLPQNFGINIEKILCNETANNTYVPRLKFEPGDDTVNLHGNSAIKFETEVLRPSSICNTETVLNTDVKFEYHNGDRSSIEATVKAEVIKTDPTENIAKLLEEFGDNYTVSIFDFEDPFLVVEISDSSDED